jgi:hypothetical protein
MTTTVSFPSDPVVNGATEIQATVFNAVAADYSPANYSAVQLFVGRNGSLDYLPNFKNGIAAPEWQFFLRKDVTGASATYRNLIGVKTISRVRGITGFSSVVGKNISVNITQFRVEVYNWFATLATLTDTTIMPIWSTAMCTYTVVVDPESGGLLYGDGSHRSLTEAMGFLLTQVAANKPTNGPAINAISGTSPLG